MFLLRNKLLNSTPNGIGALYSKYFDLISTIDEYVSRGYVVLCVNLLVFHFIFQHNSIPIWWISLFILIVCHCIETNVALSERIFDFAQYHLIHVFYFSKLIFRGRRMSSFLIIFQIFSNFFPKLILWTATFKTFCWKTEGPAFLQLTRFLVTPNIAVASPETLSQIHTKFIPKYESPEMRVYGSLSRYFFFIRIKYANRMLSRNSWVMCIVVKIFQL